MTVCILDVPEYVELVIKLRDIIPEQTVLLIQFRFWHLVVVIHH